LASTSTLGQNPLRPSSAKERVERREDKLVRRGIKRVSQRFGGSDSESERDRENEAEGSVGPGRSQGNGKGSAMEVIDDLKQDEPVTPLLLKDGGVKVKDLNGKGKVRKKVSVLPVISSHSGILRAHKP